MKKNQKTKGSVILRVAIFGVSIYMIISLCTLWSNLSAERENLAALKKVKAEKMAQIDTLNELLAAGNENAVIEKAARERLGYVFADEQVYIDISGN